MDKEWQERTQSVFDFVKDLYMQVNALMNDAGEHFKKLGWDLQPIGVATTAVLDNSPYAYFISLVLGPSSSQSPSDLCKVPFVGIDLHRETGGPVFLFGRISGDGRRFLPEQRSKVKDHWIVFSASGMSDDKFFDVDRSGSPFIARVKDSRKDLKVAEVSWLECPLSLINSPV